MTTAPPTTPATLVGGHGLDVLSDIASWLAQGEQVALATVVACWGSSPRPPGSRMAITLSRRIVGSVSGGCVEGAVLDVALEVIRTGMPQLLRYDVADETAWQVGLPCGGSMEVFVEPLAPIA